MNQGLDDGVTKPILTEHGQIGGDSRAVDAETPLPGEHSALRRNDTKRGREGPSPKLWIVTSEPARALPELRVTL